MTSFEMKQSNIYWIYSSLSSEKIWAHLYLVLLLPKFAQNNISFKCISVFFIIEGVQLLSPMSFCKNGIASIIVGACYNLKSSDDPLCISQKLDTCLIEWGEQWYDTSLSLDSGAHGTECVQALSCAAEMFTIAVVGNPRFGVLFLTNHWIASI